MMAIVVYALLSWFPGAYQTKLGQLLGAIVEPFQRWFNFATIGMIGFAPLVAIFVLGIVRSGLVYLEQIIFRLMAM
ncbi:YggT family protein [Lactobacillus sp. LC28-10]|uniref:YggT family protein n=2 Tax=Secundilactobacillus angelensis TaxID=2722706 RepID=A0ABX1L0G3_9LACO|nr:YggT family protein [Secundilactobacillus angelensis]NLR18982.1 YggT family protein [Secundilactobacillus angelensis]